MSNKASKANPLPFNKTLRDLALLRASDLDFSTILPSVGSESENSKNPVADSDMAVPNDDVQASVQRSYEFVKEARAALKILNRGEVDKEGARVEVLRSRLDEVLQGLDGARTR